MKALVDALGAFSEYCEYECIQAYIDVKIGELYSVSILRRVRVLGCLTGQSVCPRVHFL